jgi:hypothetical protein
MFAKSVTIASAFAFSCVAFGSAMAGETTAECVAGTTLEAVKQCDENVMAVATRKNEVFLLSRKGAPTVKLLVVREGEALDTATVLVRDRPGRRLESVHPAKDAIYVLVREGSGAKVLRIPVRMSGGSEVGFTQKYVYDCRNCRSFPALKQIRVLEVLLPYEGEVAGAYANPLTPGFSIALERAGTGKIMLSYDPSSGRFVKVD